MVTKQTAISYIWILANSKESGKTPIRNTTSLYKPCGGHVNGEEKVSRNHSHKNIADWCSNDRKLLGTPSFFVIRPFLLTSLPIYIYFPTSEKMAIIGTLPSRFSDKNQQLSWQIIITRVKPLHCFTNQYITYLYRLALLSILFYKSLLHFPTGIRM